MTIKPGGCSRSPGAKYSLSKPEPLTAALVVELEPKSQKIYEFHSDFSKTNNLAKAKQKFI